MNENEDLQFDTESIGVSDSVLFDISDDSGELLPGISSDGLSEGNALPANGINRIGLDSESVVLLGNPNDYKLSDEAYSFEAVQVQSDIATVADGTGAYVIPSSQYGWDVDIVVDSEWTNFVLGSDHCLVFHSDISARYGSDGRVILSLGTDNMKYFRRASHTWVDKTGSGDSYHTIGNVLLSTVDITGRGDYPTFTANYSFSGTDTPVVPDPEEPITEIDLSEVVSKLDILILNQTLVIFLMLFIWIEKKLKATVLNFTGGKYHGSRNN